MAFPNTSKNIIPQTEEINTIVELNRSSILLPRVLQNILLEYLIPPIDEILYTQLEKILDIETCWGMCQEEDYKYQVICNGCKESDFIIEQLNKERLNVGKCEVYAYMGNISPMHTSIWNDYNI